MPQMVLYRAREHRVLELLRNLALERILPIVQRAARRKIGRRYLSFLRRAKGEMQRALKKGNDIDMLEAALHAAADIFGPFKALFSYVPFEVARGKELHFKLKERKELATVLARLAQLDPCEHYLELGNAIVRADAIKVRPRPFTLTLPSQKDIATSVRPVMPTQSDSSSGLVLTFGPALCLPGYPRDSGSDGAGGALPGHARDLRGGQARPPCLRRPLAPRAIQDGGGRGRSRQGESDSTHDS